MYKIKFYLSILLVFHLLTVSCQSSTEQQILASKDGYTLKEEHYQKHISEMLSILGNMTKRDKQDEKELLIEMFNESPQETIQMLDSKTNINLDELNSSAEPLSKAGQGSKSQIRLTVGQTKLWQILGSDIGEIHFDSEKANALRNYLKNSRLSSKSNRYSSGSYSASETTIELYEDGTFIQAIFGHFSFDAGDISVGDADTDYMTGVWDVASLVNGVLVIIFYSNHILMLEDFPDGILPFFLGHYSEDFVSMPNGDGYHRVQMQ